MESPSDVLQRFFDHREGQEWMEAARLMDEQAVAEWIEGRLAMPEPEYEPQTAADVQRWDRDMPNDVAEYMAERNNRNTHILPDYLAHQFANVHTKAELSALSPLEAVARYLEALDPRYQVLLDAEMNGAYQEGSAHLEWPTRTAVGSVVESDERAYALFTESRSHPEMLQMRSVPDVAVFRKVGGRWRMLPVGPVFWGGSWSLQHENEGEEDAGYSP